MRLVVFTATSQGIFVLTAWNMNAPTAISAPLGTLNTDVFETIVLFAAGLGTPLVTAWTASVPFAMTPASLSQTALSPRTPVVESFSMTEIQRDSDLALVVQVFEGVLLWYGDRTSYFPFFICLH